MNLRSQSSLLFPLFTQGSYV